MKLGELVKEVDRLNAEEHNLLTPRLELAAKALKTLREDGLISECRMGAYLGCLEMLINNILRRVEGSK